MMTLIQDRAAVLSDPRPGQSATSTIAAHGGFGMLRGAHEKIGLADRL